jgi:hypothetical protein
LSLSHPPEALPSIISLSLSSRSKSCSHI